ncbi:protein piccolo-like [Mizuhopecten yessoensis]|uniref:protein piccolo-like n=1 Tax=Mizuhopecten yessoensis TaxID=6573 RepID=UPI000B459532|nr:protein piccolo-like [Mizuhopecten yessoensis]
MEKVTIRFLAVSFVLFLCFASVDCQWGFGLGKGGDLDWLVSNMGELDKFDLSQNRDKSGGIAIPKQHQTPGRMAIGRRYGRFIQSADDSSEPSDSSSSSSEEISVGNGDTIYSRFLENRQNNNNDGLDNQQGGGEGYNNEGEEHVYNGETGTESETQTGDNWNFNDNSQNRQSGSEHSAWHRNGGNGEGSQYNAQEMQSNQGVTYDKRSPQAHPGQQGRAGQGRQQSQQGQRGGQGRSGQHRFRNWADYQRQQERNNLGEEYEREDVTPINNSNGGHGQSGSQGQGQNEAEDRMPHAGNQSPASNGFAYEAIEPEDRTTPAVTSNKKTTPSQQEYEAEDVTTSAPGGSVTSGRVTFQRSTTEEYEMEGSRPTTSAPKANKENYNTWESGMNPNGGKPIRTGPGGRAPGPNSRGRWVNIGQMPYPRKANNAVKRNEWSAYASSVDGSSPGNGIQPRQSSVDVNPNKRQPTPKQGRIAEPVNNRQTLSGNGNSPGRQGLTDTWVGPDQNPNQKPSENAAVGSWLDTVSNTQMNLPSQPMKPNPANNNQQPKQEPLVRPSDRIPSHARPAFQSGRHPASVRPMFPNRHNQIAKPTSPNGQRLPPVKSSSFPATRNKPSTPTRWRQQPIRPAQPSGRKPEQTAQRPSWTGGSPNNVRQLPQDGWIDPPVWQDKTPRQPIQKTNTKPKNQPWNSGRISNVPGPVQHHRKPLGGRDFQRKPWNGKNLNKPNNQPRQPKHVMKKPENDILTSTQSTWRGVPVSPTLNIIDPKFSGQMPTRRGKNPPAWTNPPSDSAGRHPVNRDNIPNEKPSGSIPNQRDQPVVNDINKSVQPSKPIDSGKHMYPNDISKNPSWGGDIISPFSGDFVTEKPMVGGTKVSKRPDTGQVTVALKLHVSDASVPKLQVNDWGNTPQRGDFVYKPKPATVPQGHKPKGSRNTNRINTPDRFHANPDKPTYRDIETSTFSVINPNSKTSHTGPAIVRPTKNNRRPLNQQNRRQPPVKQEPVKNNNEHLKQIKNLINKQHPATVIKQFIEMTTANSFGVSGTQEHNSLITNIDDTLSSDNPQIINLLRDIARANKRAGTGHQQQGVPQNDVIAKMSSTAVLGNRPKTLDMASSHGSIVDGVDAEALLNSNANLHGIINSKNPGLSKPSAANSILTTRLESTKNKPPYPGFPAAGNDDAVNFGELSMTVKRVNGEPRPVENVELGQLKNVNAGQGSSKNVINIKNGRTIAPVNPTPESVTPKSWSEYNPDPWQKGVNTKPSTQSNIPGSAAGGQNGNYTASRDKGGRQNVSGTTERQQTAPVVQRQFQTVLTAQRRRQGGGGVWRSAAGGEGAWKVAARNEARELVLEKEGHWNSLSHGTRDQKVAKSDSRLRSG